MPPPDPNNRIIIPPPTVQTPHPVPATDTPAGGSAGGTSIGGAPRLEWTGNSPIVASPPAPAPPAGPAKPGASEKDDASTTSGSTSAPPLPAPAPPVDRRVVFSVKGTNTSQQNRYFSQIKLTYSGNTKASQVLFRAIKFVLSGGQASVDQNAVEVKVETSSGVTRLNNPQLKPMTLSPHASDCSVTLTPADGSVISVPPGGVITVTAKSVSGAKGAKNYFVDVAESWCNAEGELTPGAIEGFRARVPFKLV